MSITINEKEVVDTTKWKEFVLKDILDLRYGNKLDKQDVIEGVNPTINYITRTKKNNGISLKTDRKKDIEPFKKGTVTIALGGSLGACFLQEEDYYTGQNIGVIIFPENVSKHAKLFFITILRKTCQHGFRSFQYELNKHFKKDLSVKLPSTEDGKPNWKYMEEYMKEVEEKVIQHKQAVKELVNKEKEVMDTKEWGIFKIGDLFDQINVKKIKENAIEFSKEKTKEATIPLITASGKNQGISRYARHDQCPTILKNVLTISANGRCGTTFYQPEEIAILQDAYAIKLKDENTKLTRQLGSFLATILTKTLEYNFKYEDKSTWNKVKDIEIKLPAKEVNEPDWKYMEDYMKEVEEQTFKKIEQFKQAGLIEDKEITQAK